MRLPGVVETDPLVEVVRVADIEPAGGILDDVHPENGGRYWT